MKVDSYQFISVTDLPDQMLLINSRVSLVFVNGPPLLVSDSILLEKLKNAYPGACILGCSSGGELLNGGTYENSIVVSAIEFEHTKVKPARVELSESSEDEFEMGKILAQELLDDDLQMIILFSEGLAVDCDALIKGMTGVVRPETQIFGGLACDVDIFDYTVVLDRDGVYDNGVVAVGLYGERLTINTSTSVCVQDGHEIDITSAQDNIVYEINGQPALDFYDDFIADQTGLALTSRLFFPIVILEPETREQLYYRGIHEYHTDGKSLLAAGTVPEGPAEIINMTNTQHILEEASATCERLKQYPAQFSLVVSCAGRKGTMGLSWMKESSIINQELGDISQHGFYSFGEIGRCHYDNSTIFHNQTLCIATFNEI